MEKFAFIVLFFIYSGTLYQLGKERMRLKMLKERAEINQLEEMWNLDFYREY